MTGMKNGLFLAVVIATMSAPCTRSASTAPPAPPATKVAQPRPAPTAIVVLENKSASSIVGNPAAPYLNHLLEVGTRFSNYREGDPAGPSLPDYLQLVAGSSCGRFSDVVSAPDPGISRACPSTLWNQLQRAGRTWALYEQKLPSPCYRGVTYASGGDQYALKHDPGPMFSRLPNCLAHVLPFHSIDPSAMPDVSFITPSICNDMHGSAASWAPPNCAPGSQALIRRGDRRLRSLVPRLLAHGVVTFVTFDEAGLLYAVAAGPGVARGQVDDRPYSHYSWLRAIEHRYGLRLLRGATTARRLPI
jgi:phosphatidylinositol-3-phosphatase